jgi:small-conductance mechanosensitive channel
MPTRTRRSDRARFLFPIFLSAVLFLIYAVLKRSPRLIPRIAGLNIDLRDLIGKDLNLLELAAFVPLVFLVVRAFDTFAFGIIAGRRRKAPVPQLLRDIVSLVLYVLLFGSVVSAAFPKFDPRTYFASAAVIGAVLALALQDTLGNLFAGIALTMEDSFSVGDVIRSGDSIGIVEAITWRSTRIRTFNNDIIIAPNSQLARDRFEVFPRNNLNARVLPISIDYHVPPAAAIDVLTQAASHIDGVAHDAPCIARIGSFGDSGITYEIKYFTRDYAARDRIDASIRRAVWYALRRNEISIPFPVRSFQPYTPPTAQHELSRETILEQLKDIELLSPLSELEHQAIADAAAVHFYSKGETVIRRGAVGDSMFVIAKGSVSIRVPDVEATNGTKEVAQLKDGAVFGEMALLTGESRTADVVALTDVTAIEIDKHALQPILIDHPELAMELSHKVAERRDKLANAMAESDREVELTILSRVRAYFRL